MTTKVRRALLRLAWWLHLVDSIDETHLYRRGAVVTNVRPVVAIT